VSDYVDDRLDGIEFAPRGGVWRNKFREERKNVERKNKELKLLRAENARLREALEEIRGIVAPGAYEGLNYSPHIGRIKGICMVLRAALAREVKNGTA